MNQFSADIEKVNRSVDWAKQNELQITAAPAINVLIQKSNTRLSQAENALLLLGYRLDQHGNPINIQEEGREAIKNAILHVLATCTSDQSFPEKFLKKGITLKLSKEDREVFGIYIMYLVIKRAKQTLFQPESWA